MSHLLALGLLGVDCLVRAWRVQLAVCTAGGRFSFTDAFRLNLYGEAASQLTPNRLGGEPARFLGIHEAGLRPVTAIVAIGVEVACEWPVFVLAAGALIAYYVPDWRDAARIWLRHHRAGELVTLEITVLLILVTVYLLQRLARSGFVSHRVRRQRRGPRAPPRPAPPAGAAARVDNTQLSHQQQASQLTRPRLGPAQRAARPPTTYHTP